MRGYQWDSLYSDMHFLWVKPAMLKLLGLKHPGWYEFYPKSPCKLTVGKETPAAKKVQNGPFVQSRETQKEVNLKL